MKGVQTAGSSMAAALVNGFGMSAAAAETFVAVLGPAAIAIAALAATAIVIDSIVVSFSEATQKAEESRQAYEKTKSEIDNLNGELQTTQDRIDELKAKGSLTLVEQQELTKLETANALLEREIALREEDARKQGMQAASDAHDAVNNQGFLWNTAGNYGGEQHWYDFLAGGAGAANEHIDIIDYVYRAQKKANEAAAEYEGIVDKNSAAAQNAYQAMLYWQNEVTTYRPQIDDFYTSIYGYEDYQEDVERIDALYDYILYGDDEFARAQGKISEFISDSSISKMVDDAKELADTMNGMSGGELRTLFPELAAAADEAGISVDDLANTINSAIGAIDVDEVLSQLRKLKPDNIDVGWGDWNDFLSHLSVNELRDLFDLMQNQDISGWNLDQISEYLHNASEAASETSELTLITQIWPS